MKIQELLHDMDDWTMELFWKVLDTMPDEFEGKPHKANIRAYFKKDGSPKAKALSLSTQKDYQTMYDTEGFIHRTMRRNIHIFKLKRERENTRKRIRETTREDKRNRRKQVGGNINNENMVTIQQSPTAIRNQLAEEYNRLIREGNPETKELREQIHDQIQKLEKTNA